MSTIAHINGKSLSEIRFVYPSVLPGGTPTPIELGQILVVPDSSGIGKFLIRVTDIQYGQSEEWQTQIARSLNDLSGSDFSGEHEQPAEVYRADQRNQLFFEAICEPIGFVDTRNNFVSPKRIPSYFSPVQKLMKEDLGNNVTEKLGNVEFGKLRSGSDVMEISVGLFEELLPYHIGIFAQTGKGKSNTMKVIVGSIMEMEGRAGLLIFEPHGEYIKDLRRHPLAKEQLVCFTADKNAKGDPTIRQLKISYEDITVGALMNVKDQLQWTDAQERLLREAEYAYPNWLHHFLNTPIDEREYEGSGLPHTTTLRAMFPDYKDDTLKAIRSKLRQIAGGSYVSPDESVSNMDEIMALLEQGKVVLVDMASLSGLHELFLSTVLANKTLGKRRHMYSNNYEEFVDMPPVNIIMEEAQRVLGKNTNQASVFAQIVNEGRKFKTGLIAITQQPKLMSETLMSQFNTIIILGISDSKDFEVLNGVCKNPIDKLRYEIRSLMPGQALISSPLSPFAVPLQVHFYEDYLDLVKTRHRRFGGGPTKEGFKGFVQ